jgi:fused signal recognition particle receptor
LPPPENPIVELLYIAIAVLIAAAVVYFLFIRKPSEAPQLKEPAPEKKLPKSEKKPAAEKPEKAVAEKKPPADKVESKAALDKSAAAAEKTAPGEKPEASPAPADKSAPPASEDRAKGAPPSGARLAKEPGAKPSARKRDVAGLRRGLSKVRESEGLFGRLKALFTGKKEIDPQIVEQIEEVLLTSDVGVKTTDMLLADIKESLQKNELADNARIWQALRGHATRILDIEGGGGLKLTARPTVVMVVGVNGVGKTTTIGKLATKLKAEGKKVVLAAGDTFRAAAVQQLSVWGKRVGCEVVSGKDGANPGAVIFDAIQKAKEIGADVVLADTAGRLHTKTNLMEELTKVARTMPKALDGAPHETLLVLDATNGQNAMQQAAMFKESLSITGIVLTKLDGTAKGGVILGICAEHGLPVRYVGIGERSEDLRDFVAEEFVEAMLGQGESADAAA